ncbi:MAG TPA: phosphohistidine phosphatase SixA [Polyangiales bacterium]|nr:phosphohistidine phosphatase SixA [Polyangiales bacterium]
MPLLYLVRHGIAEARSASGRDDDRGLAQDGVHEMQRAAAGLARLDMHVHAIWASPLLRARQTAEILRDALAPGLELAIQPGLRPEGDVDAVMQELQAASDVEARMLVGHEPSISALGSALLTGSTSGVRLPFKPGSVLAIERASAAGRGTLRWFVTAEQLGQPRK